jgi:hypothetical protein
MRSLSGVVATRSELAEWRWSKVTDELIGQLRLSRWSGRNRRRSDHALIEGAKRCVGCYPKLIE